MIRVAILLIALLSGGAASWLALGVADQPPAAAVEIPQAPREEVLVAAAELARGAVVEEASLRWQIWEGEIPPVFISRSSRPDAIEAFKGKFTQSGFVTGEPIRDDKLADHGAGFLSSMLPSGKRAIAVRVTAESTAGGFILPNDHVDVIHTVARQDPSGGDSKIISRAILSNIRVLAVDQTVSEGADGTSVVGKTATLEVDPQQIATIAAAEASGTVSLALRAVTDNHEPPLIETDGNRRGVVRFVSGGQTSIIEVPSRAAAPRASSDAQNVAVAY
ncbi:Flp pilus assembly protein CpaB [Sinorhizobium alkalisoli]|uniref:Flp pilus assembly protein CpaB n=1 Tax=Sinorhizobium alkalisoli TaxID=1752398 RepID=A0A1E3VIQ1_9HYPH|nr:Flp pilus assembly protein CpaB [Sinorhizobium alkalisoli]MCG5478906.1 Flp pilus assembly protein CpaB [Sinorhizobium alkalisoli]ODR92886.1 Flp pilus assembly protein CpaB [Sinorhizobium alkalisoli]